MKNVLSFWLDLGVDGFRMDAVQWIWEDENFLDEPKSGRKWEFKVDCLISEILKSKGGPKCT